MNYLSYRVALFKLHRERKKLTSVVSREAEEARKTGGERKAKEIREAVQFDFDEIEDKILRLLTRYLVSKANKTFLATPSFSEEDGMWEQSNFTGNYHLTEKGIREVLGMIRKDQKERMELLSYWFPWIGLLIGLIGAITGLVAVIKR